MGELVKSCCCARHTGRSRLRPSEKRCTCTLKAGTPGRSSQSSRKRFWLSSASFIREARRLIGKAAKLACMLRTAA